MDSQRSIEAQRNTRGVTTELGAQAQHSDYQRQGPGTNRIGPAEAT